MRTLPVCTILVFCYLLSACGLEKYISIRHNVASGESMAPTIHMGDHFGSIGIRNNDIDTIRRFDIIVFKMPPNKRLGRDESYTYVSRVIGLEGEALEIKNGIVFINDVALDESSFEKTNPVDDFRRINIPAGSYFLLGDNRPNSEDSRYIGTIKREYIEGKVNTIIRKDDYDRGKRW